MLTIILIVLLVLLLTVVSAMATAAAGASDQPQLIVPCPSRGIEGLLGRCKRSRPDRPTISTGAPSCCGGFVLGTPRRSSNRSSPISRIGWSSR